MRAVQLAERGVFEPRQTAGAGSAPSTSRFASTPRGVTSGSRIVGQAGGRRESVLIIDDDVEMMHELRDGLEAAGMVVFCLDSPGNLDDSSSMVFDLVICDLAMPGVDGFEVIRRLAHLPKKPDLIIISGYGTEILHSAVIAATNYGLNVRAALQKPIDLGVLSVAICERPKNQWVSREAAAIHSGDEVYAALMAALDSDLLPAMFQPKVGTRTRMVEGFEVLLADRVPGLGQVTPQVQIKALMDDDNGMAHLVRSQIRQAADLADRLPPDKQPIAASVNLPAQLALNHEFISWLVATAHEHNNERVGFVFELTEDCVLDNDARVHEALGRLRLAGYGIALDDLGQMESGLVQFSSLPVTEVKVDAELVRQARTWPKAGEVIMAIADMAHRVGVKVTCEGVEQEADLRLALGAGADYAQGYLFAPKLTAAEFGTFVIRSEANLGRS